MYLNNFSLNLNNNIDVVIGLKLTIFFPWVVLNQCTIVKIFACGTTSEKRNHLTYCSDTYPRLWDKLISHYQKNYTCQRREPNPILIFFSPDNCFQIFQSILMLFTNCLFHSPTELLTNVFTIKHQIKVPVLTCLNDFQICAVEFQELLCLTMTLGLLQCEYSMYSLSTDLNFTAPKNT